MKEPGQEPYLGEKITVQTVSGRGGQVISRLPDGRVVLFDKNSPYYDKLAPDQSVECHVTFIHPKYIIVNPVREPEEEAAHPPKVAHFQEAEADDLVEDLEKMAEKLHGNAETITRALLHVIRLEQLIIRILTGEA